MEEDKIYKKNTQYDTLVLSGSSTKGFLVLGSLQYLYEMYLINDIETFIGTSSGSIICYLLSIGYSPTEILLYICKNQMLEKMQHFNIFAMVQGRGATSFNTIHEHLEKMTIEKIGYLPTLNDIKQNFNKNLICTTYNYTKNITEYLSYKNFPNLPCLTALRMSSNLPLIFEKFKYGDSFYLDGGVSDNFSIDIAKNWSKKRAIGILIDSNNKQNENKSFSDKADVNTLEYIYKIMFVPVSQLIHYKLDSLIPSEQYKIINLESNGIKFFQFDINSSLKLNMFSEGYKQTELCFQ